MSPSTNSPSGQKRPLWSRLTSNLQSSSSSPSSVGLGSQTGLSLTTDPSSPEAHFKGTMRILAKKICYASVAHPENNDQVERANTEILKGLKTRTYDGLKKHGKRWINELPCALWETEHHPVRPLGRRLSSWYMGLRLSSPRKSPWAPYVSRHTMKLRRTSSDMKILILSMREDDNLL
jgi:hypothetical protein